MIDRRSFLSGAAALAAAAAVTPADRTGPDWAALRRSIAGDVLVPGDPGYLGTAHELPLEQYDAVLPQAIVRCRAAEDVGEAVRFARRCGVQLVARSGGHSFAGYSTTTGMLVDLAELNQTSLRDGVVHAQAGTQLVDLHAALDPGGLSVPTGWCPTVGLGGLTLGGGLGLETRKYGVTSDRLLAADVVLADGSLVRCDRDHHADLFWALRGGGGGNFGVVTEFVFDPTPAGPVTTYTLTWPWASAGAVFDAWQRWAPFTPDDMAPVLNFSQFDDNPSVTVSGAWLGAAADVGDHLDDLVAAVGASPASSSVSTQPRQQSMMQWFGCDGMTVDQCHLVGRTPQAALPRYAYSAARGNFFERALPASAVQSVVAAFRRGWQPGQSWSYDLQALGGACNRVPATATAFVHRNTLFYAGFSFSFTERPAAAAERAAYEWLDRCWRTAYPWSSGHSYQNYVDPRLAEWRNAYYGVNYPRLARVKHAYDPSRFFDFPQAIG